MYFRQIQAGGDRNFSYIVADEEIREAAVFDPGLSAQDELDILNNENFTLKYIINTHDHFDHTGGNSTLINKTSAKVAMHESAHSYHDIGLKDENTLTLGSLDLTIIHTPGHTPDSICILVGKELISGDTLFVGKVGGTGFGNDARNEYESLHNKLKNLPPDTRVWPGHDYGVRPTSTIGDEFRDNPFLIRDSFESFVDLKANWLEYKKAHGIQ